MTQALTITHPHNRQTVSIEQGKTWLPLLAVQRRSHAIGYRMPAREYASSADAAAVAAAARRRLRNGPVMLSGPAEAAPPVIEPQPPEPIEVAHGVPLNLLAPCSWRFLVALAALRHGCDPEAVIGRHKPAPVAAARHEAFYLIVKHTVFSIAKIARMFGRDHTTILNALKKFPKVVRPRLSQYAAAPAIPRASLASDAAERLRVVTRGYSAGIPTAEIAQQIGMSPSTVKSIALHNGLRHPAKPYYGAEAQ